MALPSPPGDLLKTFDPAANVLLDLLRKQVDDAMLQEIAEADYGMEADGNLEALRCIRDRGEVPAPMQWEPKEVLELIRWSEPDDPNWQPGATGVRGHWMRAFACAALLRGAAEPANDGYLVNSENDTVAQLLASASVLGPDVQMATARFLAWRIPQLEVGERPLFAFGLLFLATLLNGDRFPEHQIASLADWVVAEETQAHKGVGLPPRPQGDLWLGLVYYGLRYEVWKAIARRLLEEASHLRSEEVRAKVQDIAARLTE
jgi:hypothetical protein